MVILDDTSDAVVELCVPGVNMLNASCMPAALSPPPDLWSIVRTLKRGYEVNARAFTLALNALHAFTAQLAETVDRKLPYEHLSLPEEVQVAFLMQTAKDVFVRTVGELRQITIAENPELYPFLLGCLGSTAAICESLVQYYQRGRDVQLKDLLLSSPDGVGACDAYKFDQSTDQLTESADATSGLFNWTSLANEAGQMSIGARITAFLARCGSARELADSLGVPYDLVFEAPTAGVRARESSPARGTSSQATSPSRAAARTGGVGEDELGSLQQQTKEASVFGRTRISEGFWKDVVHVYQSGFLIGLHLWDVNSTGWACRVPESARRDQRDDAANDVEIYCFSKRQENVVVCLFTALKAVHQLLYTVFSTTLETNPSQKTPSETAEVQETEDLNCGILGTLYTNFHTFVGERHESHLNAVFEKLVSQISRCVRTPGSLLNSAFGLSQQCLEMVTTALRLLSFLLEHLGSPVGRYQKLSPQGGQYGPCTQKAINAQSVSVNAMTCGLFPLLRCLRADGQLLLMKQPASTSVIGKHGCNLEGFYSLCITRRKCYTPFPYCVGLGGLCFLLSLFKGLTRFSPSGRPAEGAALNTSYSPIDQLLWGHVARDSECDCVSGCNTTPPLGLQAVDACLALVERATEAIMHENGKTGNVSVPSQGKSDSTVLDIDKNEIQCYAVPVATFIAQMFLGRFFPPCLAKESPAHRQWLKETGMLARAQMAVAKKHKNLVAECLVAFWASLVEHLEGDDVTDLAEIK